MRGDRARAERGLIDADLGGGLIKQRIGRKGAYRSIIAYRAAGRAFFLYGFAKADRENIDEDELQAFKKAAEIMHSLSESKLKEAVDSGVYVEVGYDEEDI